MTGITSRALPPSSLLARHRGTECYRDAFCARVPGEVSLKRFIAAFYASAAFLPERIVLRLIGRPAGKAAIAALAENRIRAFSAWSVEAREADQILLRDFQDRTCSWLGVSHGGAAHGQPDAPGHTELWFGTGIRHPESLVVRTLVPVHRWYARRLLAGAARRLSGAG